MEEKLAILLSSEVIDQDTMEFILKVKKYLERKGLIISEGGGDMFLTHLAMADMRMKTSEEIEKLDETILEKILNDPKYIESQQLWDDIKKLSSNLFSDDELGYIFLHVINMLNSHRS